VTQEFADAIGADGYAVNAPEAVARNDHFVTGAAMRAA
jgi:methanogenic corrinoid protein MtbC1